MLENTIKNIDLIIMIFNFFKKFKSFLYAKLNEK